MTRTRDRSRSYESGMSTVVAVAWAHMREGVFYLTHTGINDRHIKKNAIY